MPVIVVPREEWGALPPTAPPTPLVLPVTDIVIFPETRTKPCKTKKRCMKFVRELQKIHMECKKLPDIKYNFLVGLDGRIYEGLGWHGKGYDTYLSNYDQYNNFVSFCYIGDWSGWEQPRSMVNAVNKFLHYAIGKNYIIPNYSEPILMCDNYTDP